MRAASLDTHEEQREKIEPGKLSEVIVALALAPLFCLLKSGQCGWRPLAVLAPLFVLSPCRDGASAQLRACLRPLLAAAALPVSTLSSALPQSGPRCSSLIRAGGAVSGVMHRAFSKPSGL